jgi:hypothetical protein
MKTRKLLGFAAVLGPAFVVLCGCALSIGGDFSGGKVPGAVTVTDLDLNGCVAAPAWNETPVTAGFTSAHSQYTAEAVEWKTGPAESLADMPAGSFADKTVYTAAAVLTAKPGYTFDGAAGAFRHSGAPGASVTSAAAGSGSIVVYIRFPETEENKVDIDVGW